MKISSTSALVLLWSDLSLYQGKAARDFVSTLELSAADPILAKVDGEARVMHTHAVSCRKRFMWKEASGFLEACSANGRTGQVLILAAGISPLSIDLAERFPGSRIWDIDLYQMEEKASRITAPLENLRFLTADITDVQAWSRQLKAGEFDQRQPTLIILEGINYYIKTEQLLDILRWAHANNAILCGDFVLPPSQVQESTRRFPKEVFEIVKEEAALDFILFYSRQEFTELLETAGYRDIRFTPLKTIQEERTGSEAPFQEPNTAWIELWTVR